MQRGQWHSMQITVDHSSGNLVVIRDGVQLFTYQGTLGFGSSDKYHFEYGIYRSATTSDVQAVWYQNMVFTADSSSPPPPNHRRRGR